MPHVDPEARREYARAYSRMWRAKHPEKGRAYARAYRKRNPRSKEMNRDAELRRLYGITLEQYNEMLVRQGNACATCHKEETLTIKGTTRSLAVDHCHETGRVRGLLCYRCNTVLGLHDDDPDVFARMVTYLEPVSFQSPQPVAKPKKGKRGK